MFRAFSIICDYFFLPVNTISFEYHYRRFSCASEGDVVQQRAVVADGRRFADHNARGVVHEYALCAKSNEED